MAMARHNLQDFGRDPALSVKVGEFRYGTHIALQGIDLEIEGAGICALAGPNGSGKSTLLRLAAGLLDGPEVEVRVLGSPIRALSDRERASRMAWVPQRADPVFAMSVSEMVRVGRYRHGRGRWADRSENSAVAGSLRAVGLAELGAREVDTLSGGEWQRALLARALAQETPILLLDEPVAGLDLRHQEEAYGLFRRLARDGKIVVLADHHIELAASYADRLILLREGRLIGDGPPAEILTSTRIAHAFGVCVDVFPDPVSGSPRLSRPRVSE